MEIGDKVVAIREIQTYDPQTFLPYPFVDSGSVGTVVKVESKQIKESTLVGVLVEFPNGAKAVFSEYTDGPWAKETNSHISDSIALA